jgi:hypothetical protein
MALDRARPNAVEVAQAAPTETDNIQRASAGSKASHRNDHSSPATTNMVRLHRSARPCSSDRPCPKVLSR